MKIAITGSTGFIGSYLVKELEKEFDIILFDKNKHNLFAPQTLKSFLNNVDIVIHLAGANRDSNLNLFKTNVIGTTGLLEGMYRYSPDAKLIFASSVQVYGNSVYGLSKILAEDAIRFFTKCYGIKSIIFRISNVYGPDGKPFYNSVIATFVNLIKSNKTILINGTGKQRRDYIYVKDVVAAFKKAIKFSPKNSVTFDICSGTYISINQIVESLKKISKKEIKLSYNKQVKKLEREIKYDSSKTYKKLNWKPLVSIEQGLSYTMQI